MSPFMTMNVSSRSSIVKQCARGSKRLVFTVVPERHAVGDVRPIGEVGHDQLAKVTDAEVDLDEPADRESLDDQLEHRAISDWYKRLRQNRRVRPQSCALPARKDHGAHLDDVPVHAVQVEMLRDPGRGRGDSRRQRYSRFPAGE